MCSRTLSIPVTLTTMLIITYKLKIVGGMRKMREDCRRHAKEERIVLGFDLGEKEWKVN